MTRQPLNHYEFYMKDTNDNLVKVEELLTEKTHMLGDTVILYNEEAKPYKRVIQEIHTPIHPEAHYPDGAQYNPTIIVTVRIPT